jgi:hypothetical protein
MAEVSVPVLGWIAFAMAQIVDSATGVRPPTINATVTALRFFFKVTLDRPETTRHLVFVYEPRKLPRVLSPRRGVAPPGGRTRAQAQGGAQPAAQNPGGLEPRRSR